MIANQIISHDLSQDSNVNVVAPVAPVSNINDVPKKMSRKRTSKAETEQKMKRTPNNIIYNVSQLKKHTYNNIMENNDDGMMKLSDVMEGEFLQHDRKFHSITMNRLLEYIQRLVLEKEIIVCHESPI